MLFKSVKPRLHFSNWGQTRNVPKEDVYSIMVWTPKWVDVHQKIPVLVPEEANLVAYQNGSMGIREYSARYLTALSEKLDQLTPVALMDSYDLLVPEDAYLCCTCSKKKAANNECHRTWAAYLLAEAGWLVTLDGNIL